MVAKYTSKLDIPYWYSYQILNTRVVLETLLFIVDSGFGSYEVHFFLDLMSVENNDIPLLHIRSKINYFFPVTKYKLQPMLVVLVYGSHSRNFSFTLFCSLLVSFKGELIIGLINERDKHIYGSSSYC